MQRRVSWNDCDTSGGIRFQAAFDWFADAEVEFLRELGVTSVFGTMPRVAANASYSKALRFDDLVTIDVTAAEVGRSSLRYQFVVSQGGGEAGRRRTTP